MRQVTTGEVLCGTDSTSTMKLFKTFLQQFNLIKPTLCTGTTEHAATETQECKLFIVVCASDLIIVFA